MTAPSQQGSVSTIPTIPGSRFLGNLSDMRTDRLGFFLRLSRECGPIARFQIGKRAVIVLSAAEYVHTVLVEQAANFEKTIQVRANLGPLLGNGLLTSENEFHRRQRKLVAPAFQHRRVAAYAEIMARYTEEQIAGWADGSTLDIAHEMMRLTLRIVGKTLFDADVLQEADDLGAALTTALQWANGRFATIIRTPANWPTRANRRFRAAQGRLDATVYRMIEERRRSGEDRGDLLSMLLAARDEDDGSFMTDQQVRDEAMTLFLAGHETTANALAWTLYSLNGETAVVARLQAEADEVLAGRTPTFEDLARLPYALQVFKEGLRLYPPAPMISRQAQAAFTLGEYHFPAGTVVVISPYVLHRQPAYFSDPERFDPERWTMTNEASLPRQAYMPFGGGPRICIGNHFAMMEGQLILATLIQRLNLRLLPGQKIVPEPIVTLRPRGAICMAVERHGVMHAGTGSRETLPATSV
ncbi:MAG: cytochrome P450 [Herpetosiphonaceae bacterium]|nr:cytochrome P450 [Herpetosiphonaceae bacterium]